MAKAVFIDYTGATGDERSLELAEIIRLHLQKQRHPGETAGGALRGEGALI